MTRKICVRSDVKAGSSGISFARFGTLLFGSALRAQIVVYDACWRPRDFNRRGWYRERLETTSAHEFAETPPMHI